MKQTLVALNKLFIFTVFVLGLNVSLQVQGSPIFEGDSFHDEFRELVSEEEYLQAINDNLHGLVAYEYIAQKAQELGFRIWMFGGTAASYALFIKRKLYAEKKGIPFYTDGQERPEFFDIYSFLQDADFVIEGTKAQVDQLKAAISDNEWIQYKKKDRWVRSLWDVMTLRTDQGRGIIDSDHFLNQHNDTLSQGMIELTPVTAEDQMGAPENPVDSLKYRIRYARAFSLTSKETPFFKAVYEGVNHYLPQERHKETFMYNQGKNPQILSVLRYLVKVSRSGLRIPQESFLKMKEVLEQSQEELTSLNPYATGRIENIVTQLFLESADIHRTLELLRRLGLIETIFEMNSRFYDKHSMAWYLSQALKGNLTFSHARRHYQKVGADQLSRAINGSIFQGTLLYNGERSSFIVDLHDPEVMPVVEEAQVIWEKKDQSVQERLQQIRDLAHQNAKLNVLCGHYIHSAAAKNKYDCRDHAILSQVILTHLGVESEIWSTKTHSWVMVRHEGIPWKFDSYFKNGIVAKVPEGERRHYAATFYVPLSGDVSLEEKEALTFRRLTWILDPQGSLLFRLVPTPDWNEALRFEMTAEREHQLVELLLEGFRGRQPLAFFLFWFQQGKALKFQGSALKKINQAVDELSGHLQMNPQNLTAKEWKLLSQLPGKVFPESPLTVSFIQGILMSWKDVFQNKEELNQFIYKVTDRILPEWEDQLLKERVLQSLARLAQNEGEISSHSWVKILDQVSHISPLDFLDYAAIAANSTEGRSVVQGYLGEHLHLKIVNTTNVVVFKTLDLSLDQFSALEFDFASPAVLGYLHTYLRKNQKTSGVILTRLSSYLYHHLNRLQQEEPIYAQTLVDLYFDLLMTWGVGELTPDQLKVLEVFEGDLLTVQMSVTASDFIERFIEIGRLEAAAAAEISAKKVYVKSILGLRFPKNLPSYWKLVDSWMDLSDGQDLEELAKIIDPSLHSHYPWYAEALKLFVKEFSISKEMSHDFGLKLIRAVIKSHEVDQIRLLLWQSARWESSEQEISEAFRFGLVELAKHPRLFQEVDPELQLWDMLFIHGREEPVRFILTSFLKNQEGLVSLSYLDRIYQKAILRGPSSFLSKLVKLLFVHKSILLEGSVLKLFKMMLKRALLSSDYRFFSAVVEYVLELKNAYLIDQILLLSLEAILQTTKDSSGTPLTKQGLIQELKDLRATFQRREASCAAQVERLRGQSY